MISSQQRPDARRAERIASPRALRRRLPLDRPSAGVVAHARAAIRGALHGQDDRLVVVVGPCSIHDAEGALEYARRLHPHLAATKDALVVVMRTYFQKPRTSIAWKGFLYDPTLDGSCDVASGLACARALLQQILRLGVPCGSELLDPLGALYLEDLLSWSVIGARTAESPLHREMASGLPMPVAFKNNTHGSVEAAVHAMSAGGHAQSFLGSDLAGRASVVRTAGNPDCHLVLRGGETGPNYSPEAIASALELVGADVGRPVMVDCSHGNSSKDHRRQGSVCRAVLRQVAAGQEGVLGLLLESNLRPGRQTLRPGRPLLPGVSITDSCIGFAETARLLHEIAATVRDRRGARGLAGGPGSGISSMA